MTQFGYAASLAPWIGLVLLLCTITMLIPRTAALVCTLVTGYLGGAAATKYGCLGVMSWLGPYLSDARLRAPISFRA